MTLLRTDRDRVEILSLWVFTKNGLDACKNPGGPFWMMRFPEGQTCLVLDIVQDAKSVPWVKVLTKGEVVYFSQRRFHRAARRIS